ncbi:MAG: FAD-binding-2 domain-containing protein [Burkholderia sp.]|jgi:fumarate reductase flavoprotein subunit/urocanate reductase
MPGISRRRLLTAAAAAAALPRAALSSEEDALAGFPPFWDVIVIGSGIAGLTAAVAAREAGAKSVLVLEKGPLAGGHSIYSSGSIAVLSPKRQKRYGFEDSEDLWVEDAIKAGDTPDTGRVRFLARHSEEAVDWLEAHGVTFADVVYQAMGDLHRRSVIAQGNGAGRRYVIALFAAAQKLGVRVLYNARARALVPSGPGLGAGVETEVQGVLRTLSCGAAVIATGGFTANIAMRLRYDDRLTADIPTTANPFGLYWDGSTGDGIAMGELIGAGLKGMENFILLPYAGGRLLDYAGADIYLNARGERFVNETSTTREVIDALFHQPGRYMWVLTDSASRKGATLGLKLSNGTVHRSETLAEVARGMQISRASLEALLKLYNDAARGKAADPLGRTLFAQTIEKPPYYWGRESPLVHMTLGGLVTDEASRLLDKEGRPIEGYWAAGETVGGIFGRGRPGGMSIMSCLVEGLAAGRGAARRAAQLAG